MRTPNWVGDAVMSTPALRALRKLYPAARITLLARSYVAQIYDGGPWFDETLLYERDGEHHDERVPERLVEGGHHHVDEDEREDEA